MLRAAHASDGGGSIRVPAAACGVVGFKPAGDELGVQGFITRTVADNAFLHGHRMITPRARIGLLVEPLFCDANVDAHHLRATREAAQRLQAAGFTVVPISPYPQARATFAHFRTTFTSRLAGLNPAAGYAEWIAQQGRRVSAAELAAARAHVRQLPGLLAQEWGVDAILTPMLTTDPPRIGSFCPCPMRRISRPRPSGLRGFPLQHGPPASHFRAMGRSQSPAGGRAPGRHYAFDAALLGLAHILHP